MEFMVAQDIESIMEIAGLSMSDLAQEMGTSRIRISDWINNKSGISDKYLKIFYDLVYKKGIRLNKIKAQFYSEDLVRGREILLFHGSKTMIEGRLRVDGNKKINDFGDGFYCGESLEQSAMFVATRNKSSLYMLKFDPFKLKSRYFSVNREWMLTIAFFRGRLDEYADTEKVKQLAKTRQEIDYIVAPIADNRMFEIIDSFIAGEITDVQCQHCLSATNLGMQYVFISEKALSHITLLERCYLSELEKKDYLSSRQEGFKMNTDKVKLAKKQYRNQGEYIEDILK